MILLNKAQNPLLNLVIKYISHILIIFIINILYFLSLYFDIFNLKDYLDVYLLKDDFKFASNMLIFVYVIPLMLSCLYYLIFIFWNKEKIVYKILFFIIIIVLSQLPYSHYVKAIFE